MVKIERFEIGNNNWVNGACHGKWKPCLMTGSRKGKSTHWGVKKSKAQIRGEPVGSMPAATTSEWI